MDKVSVEGMVWVGGQAGVGQGRDPDFKRSQIWVGGIQRGRGSGAMQVRKSLFMSFIWEDRFS